MALGRILVVYRGGSLELPKGETTVGRGLECQIRFNDAGVSRRHLRFMVTEELATAQDLGTTNGTRINGVPLVGIQHVQRGDVLELGTYKIRVACPGDIQFDVEETWARRNLLNLARKDSEHPVSDTPRPSPAPPKVQTCPRCQHQGPYGSKNCSRCGHTWPAGRPVSDTLVIKMAEAQADLQSPRERREFLRVLVDVPVIYESDSLTFDAAARDLSLGGMFVATELLDEVGTPCSLTLLPDGSSAMTVAATVCRISSLALDSEKPPGMGVRFTKMGRTARVWLEETLALLDALPSSELS